MLRESTISTPLTRGFLLPDVMKRICINCGFHGPETLFKMSGAPGRRGNICKECDKARLRTTYHADVETSRE